jgi:hypothetical protein
MTKAVVMDVCAFAVCLVAFLVTGGYLWLGLAAVCAVIMALEPRVS